MRAAHLRRGSAGEKIARKFLSREGLVFLAANYRCRCGEIDLIMLEKDCLVFIEVRYRRSNAFGGALASVTADKQIRLGRTASHFLQHHRTLQDHSVRFDVVALSGRGRNLKIDWRQNAFLFDGIA